MRETCLVGAAALRNNTAANTCPFLSFPCPDVATNHPREAWVTPEPCGTHIPSLQARTLPLGRATCLGTFAIILPPPWPMELGEIGAVQGLEAPATLPVPLDSGRGKEVRNALSLCWNWLLDGFVPSQTRLFLWAREKQRLGALDTGVWSLLTLLTLP